MKSTARRRRFIAVLTAVLTALGIAAIPSRNIHSPRMTTASCDQVCQETRDTVTWLRNNAVGRTIGPNAATGYGETKITGFTLTSAGHYRVNLSITDHDPTLAAGAHGAQLRALDTTGFCWPWQDFTQCSVWNDLGTWDWRTILNRVFPDPFSSVGTTRVMKCYNGAFWGWAGVIGKGPLAALLDMADEGLREITPEGAVLGLLAGCTLSLVHP